MNTSTHVHSAIATIRQARWLPRALSQRRCQTGLKYNCMVQEVRNIHQVKVNEHDENE